MLPMEIRILPEADDFIQSLPDILLNEGHKSSYESAVKLVDDILDFIQSLSTVPHYRIPSAFEYHYSRYGVNLYYAFYKRKSSPRTTWYVFFEKQNDLILVKHISNNWLEGQYIR